MSEPIKRYKVDFGYGRYFFDPSEDGDWVTWQGHLDDTSQLREALLKCDQEVAELQAERDAFKKAIISACSEMGCFCDEGVDETVPIKDRCDMCQLADLVKS
jgi:hypothetical protein